MKDLTLPPSKVESKPPDHGYAKSASISTKKAKKHEVVVDPKQRRLPFAKVPASQTSVTTYVSSDSDEPLASITAAEGNSVSSMKKSAHSVNGVEHKHSPLKQLDKCSKDKVEVVPSKSLEDKAKERKVSSPKFTKSPSLIPSPDISKKSSQAQNPLSIKAGEKKEKAKLKKLSNGNKVKKSTQSKKKEPNRSNKKMKKVVVALSTDSDSDLDVPLSQLKASPKQKKKPKIKNVKSVNSTAMSERSPKVKISHAKSPKSKDKKGFKQRTLFDFSTQMKKGSAFAKEGSSILSKDSKPLGILVKKIDWKGLTEEEREKMRQKKKEEWNRLRREKNKLLNQKYDDLELSSITPLPVAKPINLQGGLSSSAFGDIAMVVEFIYSYSKFLAPEETPTITAELLIKALAAGNQGANVISKIVLIFLRALIGDEEREINGLGIGLADMPLTVFTVSELLYQYLKLTCEKLAKEKKEDDEDDDASSVGSEVVEAEDKEELPRRIIDSLEKNELFALTASDQLKVLVFLFYKIIDSEYFSEYLENLKMEAKELWREQDAFRKKTAKDRKDDPGKANDVKSSNESPKIDQFAKKVDSQATNERKDDEVACGEKGGEDDEDAKIEVSKKEEKDAVVNQDGNEKYETLDMETKSDVDIMKDYPKEPVADLVHIVRQRRIMAAKQAARKDEEERKNKERRNEIDELRQKMKKVQAWKDSLDRCKKSLRLEPIGMDRHFKLYWVFSHGMPGIYVEDGYMYNGGEKRTINSWEHYDTAQDIDKLLKSLARQGMRESALKACISNQYKSIINVISKKNQEYFDLQPYDVFDESIKVLKEDLLESGAKIVNGVLGMIPNHEVWEKQVEEGKSLEEMAPLLLELQQSVVPKFLQGAMDQSKGEQIVQNWRDNVKQVKTMSALHTLLGILENSVKWDKSAENAKCKICRHKGGDAYLVLCDECNRAYHPYCLRPALIDFPAENWKCPACAPSMPISRSRNRRKEEAVDYDETAQDDESGDDDTKEEDKETADNEQESDHDSQCHVCGEDGELICCDRCPKVYHFDCHEPPIRRLPRGIWICFVCRTPKLAAMQRRAEEKFEKQSTRRSRESRKQKKRSGRHRSSRKQRLPYQEEDGDEEESSEMDSEMEDEAEEVRAHLRRKGSNRRKSRRKEDSSSEGSEDEEDPAKMSRRQSERSSQRKKWRSSNTGDESSEPSPKTKRRGVERSSRDKGDFDSRRGRRRAGRRSSYEDKDNDPEDRVSKRTTRKRKSGDSFDAKVDYEKRSKMEERNSGELSFGRRSRNRNRGGNSEIVACENILRGMWKSKNAHHFRDPVDLKKVPDYEKFVANPIDLRTIKEKLNMLEYEDAFQFVDDVKLLFDNSRCYNEDTSDVGRDAKGLETEFYELLCENLPGLHYSVTAED